MGSGRILWYLGTSLAGLAVVVFGAYAQAHGRWGIWDLLLAAPWPFFVYKTLIERTEAAAPTTGQESSDPLAGAYRAATIALASAIGAKDSYIHPYANRVPRICELVAGRLKFDSSEIEKIKLAALIRDVGKLGVPDYILLKPGPLDTEEFAKMRNHAAIGANLLRQAHLPDDVVNMVLYHHEKHDGTGYPEKLAGDRIPLGSRVIAVAVVYDALVSDRCYRNGWSHSEAIAHLERLSGSSFDPKVVEAFLAVEPQVLAIDAEAARDERIGDTGPAESSCAAVDTIAQANRELMSLFDIAQTLSSTLEIDEVLALLAHRTRRLLQGSTCAVLTIDEAHPKSLVARAAVGRFEDAIKGARARYGKGITGKTALRLQPRSGNYDPNDLELVPGTNSEPDFRSCIVAPIVSYGELLGTINVYDVCPRSFTHDEIRILTFVAHQAALAVQNAKAFEEVRDFALRDPLTNLRNGRFLRHCLDRELSRCSRLGEPLSVLGIDLDNFKGVNDLKGHEAGDAVLIDVADVFRHELRDYDVIVRNGGDEFVVVLPGTSIAEAHQTAERIRVAVDYYAGRGVSEVPGFGASVGVASYPADGIDAESLLARADAAMYRDKRSRRQHRLAA
jgi:diguanylate cyclase (GGDEF)-like protein